MIVCQNFSLKFFYVPIRHQPCPYCTYLELYITTVHVLEILPKQLFVVYQGFWFIDINISSHEEPQQICDDISCLAGIGNLSLEITIYSSGMY